MSKTQIKPYYGEKPYIFISYAHRDSDEMLEIVECMSKNGLRIWYDEGIDPGTEWDEFIAAHIDKCSYFCAFISEAYLESDNCKDELNYARDLDIPRLLIYLDDVQLPKGMQMRLGRLQAIHKYTYEDSREFFAKLFQADGIEICRRMAGEEDDGTAQYPGGAGSKGDQSSQGSGKNRRAQYNTISSRRETEQLMADLKLGYRIASNIQVFLKAEAECSEVASKNQAKAEEGRRVIAELSDSGSENTKLVKEQLKKRIVFLIFAIAVFLLYCIVVIISSSRVVDGIFVAIGIIALIGGIIDGIMLISGAIALPRARKDDEKKIARYQSLVAECTSTAQNAEEKARLNHQSANKVFQENASNLKLSGSYRCNPFAYQKAQEYLQDGIASTVDDIVHLLNQKL